MPSPLHFSAAPYLLPCNPFSCCMAEGGSHAPMGGKDRCEGAPQSPSPPAASAPGTEGSPPDDGAPGAEGVVEKAPCVITKSEV
eukprot:1140989-Pelagomonas_calceolata.AAC.4